MRILEIQLELGRGPSAREIARRLRIELALRVDGSRLVVEVFAEQLEECNQQRAEVATLQSEIGVFRLNIVLSNEKQTKKE
jgi:hypothetical protein